MSATDRPRPDHCPTPECGGSRDAECDCCVVAVYAGDARFGYIGENGVYNMARGKGCPCRGCPGAVEIRAPDGPQMPLPHDNDGSSVMLLGRDPIPFAGELRSRTLRKFGLEPDGGASP